MTAPPLLLRFDVDRLIAVEMVLGRPISAIVAEMGSADGAGLVTLRALIAAGSMDETEARLFRMGASIGAPPALDLARGARLVGTHGLAACALMAMEALGATLAPATEETV